MSEVLRREIVLNCHPDRAFRAFTDHVDLWWPRTHRKSRDHSLRLSPDGLIQIAPDGTEWTMGRLLAFEPPDRLTMDWFAGAVTDPTHVEVTFNEEGRKTRVVIIHRTTTPETVELWPQRVAIFADGWDAVLQSLDLYIGGEANG